MSSHEAVACHLEGLLMDGEPMPEREYKDGIWALIEVDSSKLLSRTRRVAGQVRSQHRRGTRLGHALGYARWISPWI